MKSLLSGVVHAGLWVINRKSTRPSQIHDYLQSVSHIKKSAIFASQEIQSEKHKYRIEIVNAMFKVKSWPVDLTNIIIQYTASFANEVAEQRLKEDKFIKFWKHEPDLLIEPDTRKKVQEFQYELYTSTLKDILEANPDNIKVNYNPYDVVIEYLVDPDIDDLEKVLAESKAMFDATAKQEDSLNEEKAINASLASTTSAAPVVSPLRRNSLMRSTVEAKDEAKVDIITGKPAPLPAKRKDKENDKEKCLVM